MTARIWLLSSVSALALATASGAALAADPYATPGGPAVSAQNAKIAAFAGAIGGDFTLGSTGSLAFPLSGPWGAQFDGMFGTAGGGTFYGIGGHLFWRDPSKGLLGVTASYVGWGGISTTIGDGDLIPFADITGASVGKIGVEAESYLGRVSLEGAAAYQFGSDQGLAGHATAAFYPTDDLRLDVSYTYLQGAGGAVGAGAEWMPGGNPVSFFATASVGHDSDWTVFAGLKAYFGESNKALIRRHREDDPDNLLPTDLYKAVGDQYCFEGDFVDVDGRCDSVH